MISRRYYPSTGGNQNQCRLLAEGLVAAGVGVTVLTARHEKTLPPREVLGGVEVLRVSLTPRRGSNPLTRKLAFLLEETQLLSALVRAGRALARPTIVHVHQSHWISVAGYRLARSFGVPLLVKEAGLGQFSRELGLHPWGWLYRQRLREAAHWVTLSQKMRDDLLADGLSIEKLHQIPNGVAIPEEKWQDGDQRTVLFLGNFDQGRIKGLDVLLRAWNVFSPAHPGWRLRLVGKGETAPYQALLDRAVAPSVDWVGPTSQARQEFLASAIYVLPSRSEGMSNSLLEAAALGVPSVAADVSGVREILGDGRGEIVGVEAVEELASVLGRLAEDPDRRARQSAELRSRAREHFSLAVCLERYLDLYRRLA